MIFSSFDDKDTYKQRRTYFMNTQEIIFLKALCIVIKGACAQYLFDIAVEFKSYLNTEEGAELASATVSLKSQFTVWTFLLSKIIYNSSYNYYIDYL